MSNGTGSIVALAGVSILGGVCTAVGQEWTEVGDAPEVVTADAQQVVGVGPLLSITGATSTAVDDFVDALLRACVLDDAVGHSFNIGNPRATVTTLHLAQEVLRAAGVQVPIRFVPWGKANVHLRVPDISQARGLLEYEPAVDLAEGLGKTIGWYRELDDVGTVP